MSTYKNRTKFAINGWHPLTQLLQQELILHGCVLVEENPDFYLAGPAGFNNTLCNIPTLALSSDVVYSDRDANGDVLPQGLMVEDQAIVIPDVVADFALWTSECVIFEHRCIRSAKALIVRPSGVFGSAIQGDITTHILRYVTTQQPVPIYKPGYQVRTFLHQEDFVQIILRLVKRLLTGTVGIVNVTGKECISIRRLADTLWQAKWNTTDTAPLAELPLPKYYRWWVKPDITTMLALTQYDFPKSLRSRLQQLI